jgi:radical SAM protein with 4Fe4S-binding SPASM domain
VEFYEKYIMKSLLSLGEAIVRSNFSDLPHPFKLTYAVTYRCNSRCTICSIWKRKTFTELSQPEIDAFFTKNNYFNWIDITGGEVFMKPRLLSIVETIMHTQNNLYLLHIPTNGILTGKILRDVREILDMKPNKFIITCSIDGPPALHDKLRGIKDNWKQTVQTYRKLKELSSGRFNCYFGMTLSGYNFQTIEQTYRALKWEIPELSPNDLHFNIAHHSYHYYGNTKTALGDTAQIGQKLAEFNRQKSVPLSGVSLLDRMFQDLVPAYLKTHKTPVPCKALSSSLFLDPDGTMYPCSMWSLALGNIRDIDYDLEAFWKSPVVAKTRRVISLKNCPNCWTPCEAYQSILGNLRQSLIHA